MQPATNERQPQPKAKAMTALPNYDSWKLRSADDDAALEFRRSKVYRSKADIRAANRAGLLGHEDRPMDDEERREYEATRGL